MRLVIVAGIDPSITHSGVCLLDLEVDTVWPQLGAIEPRTVGYGKTAPAADDIEGKHHRMSLLAFALADEVKSADVIAIEALSYASSGAATRDLAGFWWLVVDELLEYDGGRHRLVFVAPAALKRWATGKGNASKSLVASSMARRWDMDLPSDDEADALALASLCAYHHGGLPWQPTQLMRDAHDSVRWPV